MKKCSGFTLVEVMLSFFILSVLTATILPAFVTIYNERMTIKQERQAHYYISNVLQEWLYDDKQLPHHEIVTIDDTNYVLQTENDGDEIKVCLKWDGRNERSYSVCNYGKKS